MSKITPNWKHLCSLCPFYVFTTARFDGGGQFLGESSFGQMKDVTERILHPHGEGSVAFVYFSIEDHEHPREA
jgi:hypothetical protein